MTTTTEVVDTTTTEPVETTTTVAEVPSTTAPEPPPAAPEQPPSPDDTHVLGSREAAQWLAFLVSFVCGHELTR